MKLQLLSDLHTEFEAFEIPETEADVIVLAGDIGIGCEGVEWACRAMERLRKPVIYVPGNHEFFGAEFGEIQVDMRTVAALGGVHLLNNDSVIVGGVEFLGTTTWTDYRAPCHGSIEDVMAHCKRTMADHRLIKFRDRKFMPEDALYLHEKSISWLEAALIRDSSANCKVVITHHGPSRECVNPQFGLDMTSGAFVSNMEWLLPYADLWCYGHTHHCFDAEILGCRVVSNQRGYPFERTGGFDPRMVIEIPGSGGSEAL